MAQEDRHVVFHPPGSSVKAAEGDTILDAARRGKIFVNSPCGGKGTCGKCRIRVTAGRVDREESHHLDRSDAKKGWALACRTAPVNDV
ncbi:MAG: 2Fe-2S iron-sulfur cluster-binding protein, partial [Planctomycetota bacterium]